MAELTRVSQFKYVTSISLLLAFLKQVKVLGSPRGPEASKVALACSVERRALEKRSFWDLGALDSTFLGRALLRSAPCHLVPLLETLRPGLTFGLRGEPVKVTGRWSFRSSGLLWKY